MGRRPNAIISEYFTRGEKLNDHSNRYAHTCKRCGELFPKGRIDRLTTHLLRKCPSVAPDDREHVFRGVQQQHPDVQTTLQRVCPPVQQSPVQLVQYAIPEDQQHSPLVTQRGQSALDTLAEASRRHLDSRDDVDDHYHDTTTGRQIAEQALLAQLQHAASLPDPPKAAAEDQSDCTPEPVLMDAQSPQISEPATVDHTVSVQLVTAASAATEQLQIIQTAQTPPLPPQSSLDPQLVDAGSQLEHQVHSPVQQAAQSDAMLWNPVFISKMQNYGHATATTSHEPAFGLLQRSDKNKARGRFTDVRRKEVQETRKRGACIRCRMLKKPCSEGTPCNTCKGVESARLWKGSCFRTKLADEFALWSTGLFHSRASIAVSSAIHGLECVGSLGRIEARFFSTSQVCISFAARQYARGVVHYRSVGNADFDFDPNWRQYHSSRPDDGSSPFWVLDTTENIATKIEGYAQRDAASFIAEEKSPFVKATLQRAYEMTLNDAADADVLASSGTRSCYHLQGQLLNHVVELWVETCILTTINSNELSLYLTDRLDLIPKMAHSENTSNTEPPTGRHTLSQKSRELIHAQLLAATESRCLGLSKSVMNEIERRLLQRQQASRFETFLCSTILLNCIERMTGAYRAFDITPQPQDGDEVPSVHTRPPDWPLDETPFRLWSQGEHFAEVLIMLLRMRALPPRTTYLPEGQLVVLQNHSQPANMTGRQAKEQTEDQTKISAEWLNPMCLQREELLKIRDGGLPGQEEDVGAWDMKFVSRVLLPESS